MALNGGRKQIFKSPQRITPQLGIIIYRPRGKFLAFYTVNNCLSRTKQRRGHIEDIRALERPHPQQGEEKKK